MPDRFLSPEEVAARAGCSSETVRRHCRKNRLPHVRLSPWNIQIHVDDAEEFISSRSKTAPAVATSAA